MRDYVFTVDKKNSLIIGYVSPGWPLCDFPNGIVAYIQNILYGLDDKIKPVILAQTMLDSEPKNDVINLSNFTATRGALENILDKIIYGIKLPYLRSTQYQRWITYVAKNISIAIEQLDSPLSILEMEESFGTVHFLMRITKVPVVTRLHGPWFLIGPILNAQNNWDFKLRVFYEKKAIENAHGVTSPSLDVLEKVRAYYGLALPHAKVIPNPVPEVSVENQWQFEAHKKPSILFVGRFDSVKGADLMLLAFRIIALKNKATELIFAGPDRGLMIDDEHFNFNEYIARFIPENAIKKRIRFLGHCDQLLVSNLRKEALVTVVCSRYESFSISLLEALSAGCPTVATAVGGMKEIIIDDYNGLFACPESPKSIAEKVLTLIDDPDKMQLLSKNAMADCKKRFSPEVVASQTIDYYKFVLAKSAS